MNCPVRRRRRAANGPVTEATIMDENVGKDKEVRPEADTSGSPVLGKTGG